jgi:hypothetical protein
MSGDTGSSVIGPKDLAAFLGAVLRRRSSIWLEPGPTTPRARSLDVQGFVLRDRNPNEQWSKMRITGKLGHRVEETQEHLMTTKTILMIWDKPYEIIVYQNRKRLGLR